ncbi:hypothetical protein [Chromobacterium phragmitis]|uniref:Terminase n=1 Tax=Chromobacterium phragmitis TaxID=2202141 RepID=A0ABV0J0I5_9NEIS
MSDSLSRHPSARFAPTPGKLFMHKGQKEVFSDNHRFRVVVAGRRWGKSQISKILIMKYAAVKNRLIWYVAPSYRMSKQIMWPELLASIPKKWIKKVNETNLSIKLVNGTLIELKGADNPDSLRGVGIHFLVMDEVQDITPDAWIKVLRPTLASTGGHALFIGSPKAYNFLYDLYMLGQRGETYINAKGRRVRNQWRSWQFPTITSPFIPASEIESARADMDEKSFNQEFMASFESMSGRVYHAFDRKTHVGTFPFNPALPIWIGQDFNIDPMSAVVMQPQPSGEVWIVDEIVLPSSNTSEAADEIERRYWRYIDNITLYPDPAGAHRQHGRGESDLDIMREKGLKRQKFRRKHPPVADRVNAVNKMFKAADGSIRLRVDERCKETITSLEQTQYKEGSRDVDKAASVEHSADALGYCIEYEFPSRAFTPMGISL